MELWASGFNAWNQCNFEEEQTTNIPLDLQVFRCILKDESIELLRATVVSALVRTSKGTHLAGRPAAITQLQIDDPEHISKIAIAGNDRVIGEKEDILTEYTNLSEYIQNTGKSHGSIGKLGQLTAGQTFFTALSTDGEVFTWGDARYESTLGREVSPENPAQLPSLVPDLCDLPTGPIRKISSGGYVSAALTKGDDLYLWGGRAGQSAILSELASEPSPFDLEGEDILDVAVGNDHIIALSVSHRVFVVGSNSNGQLGLEGCKRLDEWKEIVLPLREDQLVVSVYAGYKNSFALVENKT